jgi:selenide,water dikinase
VLRAYALACASMTRLNRTAARLMHKHGAHAATDVTGFGILGHASNLASNQAAAVSFVVHTLPVWRGMAEADAVWAPFKLLKGLAPETSGGLLVALPRDRAQAYIAELAAADGLAAWIVGDVVPGAQVCPPLPSLLTCVDAFIHTQAIARPV